MTGDTSNGDTPGGREDWKAKAIKEKQEHRKDRPVGKYDHWLIPKFSDIERGSRLTPERIKRMIVGEELSPQERDLLLEMLYNREAALAWDLSEIGRVKEDVAPPQEIRTIPHKAWQASGFPVPIALEKIVIEMLKERLKQGTLERCHGPYRNPWFLVEKKNGEYQVVNAAMAMNAVTVRDANLPPVADDFCGGVRGDANDVSRRFPIRL